MKHLPLALALLVAILGAHRAVGAPTPEERSEAAKLLGEYRKAENFEQQKEIVEKAVALGDYSRGLIFNIINREVSTGLSRYQRDVGTLVSRWVQVAVARADKDGVKSLREGVLGLLRDGGLTKNTIKEKADPAMKQLAEWFEPTREKILDKSEALQKRRTELANLIELRDLCKPEKSPDKSDKSAKTEKPEKSLESVEDEILAMAMASRTDLPILQENKKISETIDSEEYLGIVELNRIRMLLGMNALRIDTKLSDASRDHSKDMKTKGFFAHDSPVPGKTTPWDRAKNFGTTASAENISNGNPKGTGTIERWWYSPGHFKNLLGSAQRIGLGRYEAHWTQMFGR